MDTDIWPRYRGDFVATRNAPTEPEPEAQRSGLTDADRDEIRQMVADLVGGTTAPTPPPAPSGPAAVTDAEWDTMSDRRRESWIRSLVDFRLDELSRDDEIRRQRADIDRLKEDKTPEPEAAPSVVTKLQKWMWGEPDK